MLTRRGDSGGVTISGVALLTTLAGLGAVLAGATPGTGDRVLGIAQAVTARTGAGDLARCVFRHDAPSSVAFVDARARHAPGGFRQVRDGGVVELHASPSEAARRVREIQAQTLTAQRLGYDEGGQPLRREHLVRSGPVLLRLSPELSTSAVLEYRRALDVARGAAAGEPRESAREAPCST